VRQHRTGRVSASRGALRPSKAYVILSTRPSTNGVELCSASEDLDEELRKSELLPITVQQAYVLARMCRDDDVAKLYETVRLDEFVAIIHLGQSC